jgi:DNA-binding NarL/FixJ family response regulator
MIQAQSEIDLSAMFIVDALQLRRAGLVGLLQTWAQGRGLLIAALAPEDLVNGAAQGRKVLLSILNLGGSSVSDRDAQEWIRTIKERLPGSPLVIVSDHGQAAESIAAFEAGARGYIPTSVEPSIALQALSFIIGGGSFFPPTALLDPSNGSGHVPSMPGRKMRRENLAIDLGLTYRQRQVIDLLQHGITCRLRLAVAAADAGKHILLVKLMAPTLAECDRIARRRRCSGAASCRPFDAFRAARSCRSADRALQ